MACLGKQADRLRCSGGFLECRFLGNVSAAVDALIILFGRHVGSAHTQLSYELLNCRKPGHVVWLSVNCALK